jgi:DnaJ-class molecular chaperone
MGSSEEATNYYAILGAGENASQEELERLYKRLAMRHHPDRGGDAEYMKAINEAYRVLGNEAMRHAYDASGLLVHHRSHRLQSISPANRNVSRKEKPRAWPVECHVRS